MRNNSERLQFVINNKTFWSVTLISIILTTLFFVVVHYGFKSVNFNIIDIIQVFSTLILVMSLFFYSKIFIQTNEKHDELLEFEKSRFRYDQNIRNENNNIKKLQYSFEITENWHKPEMAKMVNRSKMFLMEWEKHINDGGENDPRKFNDKLNEDPKNRTALIAVLNYFEHICILIEEDFADEKAVKKAFSHLFKLYLLKTENYIKHRQETENSKSIYVNFLKYALKWAEV